MNCKSLTNVYIVDIAKWCSISFDGSYANPLCYAKNLYLNGDLVTELVIPEGVTSIVDDAFAHCECLTSVEIPDSVTRIGNASFNGCKSLTSVEIPGSVTRIGNAAFYGAINLMSIKYRGTEEQWNGMDKGMSWDYNTGNYTITYNYTGE